jgi:hypothetical protein
VKPDIRLGVVIALLGCSIETRCANPDAPSAGTPSQHFVCNTGYALEKCRKDVAVLRKVLDKYPVGQLGEWTWVLVRSSDWKAIKAARGLDPDSPAFTYYAGKETFVEEVLVTQVPGRGGLLLVKWGMSMENLLDFAIAHELSHAVCNEKDESKTERVARLLREGKPASCDVTLQAKGRRGGPPNRLPAQGNSD